VDPRNVWDLTYAEAGLIMEREFVKRSVQWDHTALLASVIQKTYLGKKGRNPEHFHPMRRKRAYNWSEEFRQHVKNQFTADLMMPDIEAVRERKGKGKDIRNSIQLLSAKWKVDKDKIERMING